MELHVTLILGGMLGGSIMGLYWTLTSTLFNMHTGDAFGALGIRHYKHFLRISSNRTEPRSIRSQSITCPAAMAGAGSSSATSDSLAQSADLAGSRSPRA